MPAVIPVYRIQGDRVQQNALDNVSSVASTSSFMKLTASNLGHGSAYYWWVSHLRRNAPADSQLLAVLTRAFRVCSTARTIQTIVSAVLLVADSH